MATDYAGEEVVFHGINEVGKEDGNESITDGRDIAWLQDDAETNAWGMWSVDYRDAFVLDREGSVEGVVNLTAYDLSEERTQLMLTTLIDDALAR
jgi:hypothetical protein